jgi:hypothetical protein
MEFVMIERESSITVRGFDFAEPTILTARSMKIPGHFLQLQSF